MRIIVLGLIVLLGACSAREQDFSDVEIVTLHDQIQRGELNSEQLVSWYIDRIESLDRAGPKLNSIIEINPDALKIARSMADLSQIALVLNRLALIGNYRGSYQA